MNFNWSEEKNNKLKLERNITFQEIIVSINIGGLLASVNHPNQDKYKNQKVFLVKHNDYIYLVPYINDENGFFLKTIIPSRKATKEYLKTDYEN